MKRKKRKAECKNIKITVVMICAAVIVSVGLAGCAKTEKEETGQIAAIEKLENKQENSEKEEDSIEDSKENEESNVKENKEKEVQKDLAQAELCGNIQEIGDKQFTVSEITVTKIETGGSEAELAVMEAPGEDGANRIRVRYDDKTIFIKQKIWNGGADYDESAATEVDLKKEMIAEMKGNYKEDIFYASEIKLVEVIS